MRRSESEKMSTTPKWYCRNKSQPMHTFAEIGNLGLELRRITKRIVIDVNSAIFSEHVSSVYIFKVKNSSQRKGEKTFRVVLLNVKLGRVGGLGIEVRVRDLARTLRALPS